MIEKRISTLSLVLCLLLIVLTSDNASKPCYANTSILIDSSFTIIVPFGKTKISSRKFHYGVDLKADQGKIFCSPVRGIVTFKGYTPMSTETLTIRTEDNLLVSFLNLSKVKHNAGDPVDYGEPLGVVDLNPRSSTTTPHIHLSVRDSNGKYLNPALFITFIDGLQPEKANENDSENSDDKFSVPVENELLNEVKPELNSQSSRAAESGASVKKQNLKESGEIKPGSFLKESSARETKPGNIAGNYHSGFPFILQKQIEELSSDTIKSYHVKREAELQNSRRTAERSIINHCSSCAVKLQIFEKRQTNCCSNKMSGKPDGQFSKKLPFTTKNMLAVLSLFIMPVIIWRRSLLPARTGGRLSPQGGEYFARI